jgi:hypothetical protein
VKLIKTWVSKRYSLQITEGSSYSYSGIIRLNSVLAFIPIITLLGLYPIDI